MANQLCLYCAKPGHIASNCPISRCPYTGISVRQLGTTPEGDLSIQTGIEDLNINAVAAFNVIDKMVVDPKTEDESNSLSCSIVRESCTCTPLCIKDHRIGPGGTYLHCNIKYDLE